MKWKLWIGKDKKSDILISVIFIILVLWLIWIWIYMCRECYVAIRFGGENILKILFLSSPFTILPIVLVIPYFDWNTTKYKLEQNGIHTKTLFSRRFIEWERVQLVQIYMVFQRYEVGGIKCVLIVLHSDKMPKKLTFDHCYIKKRYIVLFRATEDRVEELRLYCPIPVIDGKQTGNKRIVE